MENSLQPSAPAETAETAVPNPLFRYLPPCAVTQLEDEEVRFTPPNFFNDPFELTPHIPAIRDKTWVSRLVQTGLEKWKRENSSAVGAFSRRERRARERRARKEVGNAILEEGSSLAIELQDMLPGALSDKIGILCLSAVSNDLLMWAHYADSHKGFVVALDTSTPEFKDLGHVFPVIYSEERPQYTVGSEVGEEMYYAKSPEWKHEREYRIIRMLEKCGVKKSQAGWSIFFRPFPRSCVSAVYLGVRMERELKRRIGKLFSSTRTTVYEGALDRQRFRVGFTELMYRNVSRSDAKSRPAAVV